jgi:methyltransferase
MLAWLAVAGVVFGVMLLEAARASRNERRQRARGGIEPTADVYSVMRVAYPAAFAAMIAEGIGRGVGGGPLTLVGVVVFAAAKALKWWAIVALGRSWTFRVIVVPGAPLVSGGPYRFFRHPNYVGVMGELAGVALMAHARVTGPAALLAFGLLIVRRIGVEERTLREVGHAASARIRTSK